MNTRTITNNTALSNHSGNNNTNLQHLNRRLILNLIRRNKVISRTDLAQLSNLKQATISIIINEFISAGLVEDCGLIEGNNGRRIKGVRICLNKFCTINIRITASYYAISLVDITNECIVAEKTPFLCYNNLYDTLLQLTEKINRFIALSGDLEILGISIGVHNGFTFHNGNCIYSDVTQNIKINVSNYFSKTLLHPFYIQRSADFTSTWLYHSNSVTNVEQKIVLFLDLSTTIDFSILYHGELYQGYYSTSQNLDYMYIKNRNNELQKVEEVITVEAIINRAKELLKDYPHSPLHQFQKIKHRNLIECFEKKDPLTLVLYDEIADGISQTIIHLINLFGPDCIFIGDEIPPTDAFLHLINSKIQFHSNNDFIQKIPITIVSPKRTTATDASLLGGSSYVFDVELPLKYGLHNK